MANVQLTLVQVRILSIEKSQVLRTGDRAQVSFEFMNTPEFVKKGQKLLFRELSHFPKSIVQDIGLPR